MKAYLSLLVACLLLIVTASAAVSHPMPNSVLLLDRYENRVDVEANIPITDLGLAMRLVPGLSAQDFFAAHKAEIAEYLRMHTAVSSPDGAVWRVSVTDMSVKEARTEAGGYGELSAHLILEPPDGVSTAKFTLTYDAVIHQVISHVILVSVRTDWMNGQIGAGEERADQVGAISVNTVDGSIASLEVDLSNGSYTTGFLGMLKLGMNHIAAGIDHLLFLFVLLIPAPLLAVNKAWRDYAGARASFGSVIKIVTAFSIGHSITLAIASLFRLDLPQEPIEVAIALTIMIGAIHAFRPVFPGCEAYVAGIFGLIHGMAFSFTLVELNLSAPQLIASLVAFNLGIELVQIALVLVVMPTLLILAKTKRYSFIRIVCALVALIAAFGWCVARLGINNPISDFADRLGVFAPYIVAMLVSSAIIALIMRLRSGQF